LLAVLPAAAFAQTVTLYENHFETNEIGKTPGGIVWYSMAGLQFEQSMEINFLELRARRSTALPCAVSDRRKQKMSRSQHA